MYLLFSFHMFTSILSTSHTYVDSLYQLQCKIEWFHFGCVGLKEKPKGKWYCSNCAATRNRRRGKWGWQKNKIKCQNGWVYILNIFGTVVRALKLCFCSCLGRFWINFQWPTMSCHFSHVTSLNYRMALFLHCKIRLWKGRIFLCMHSVQCSFCHNYNQWLWVMTFVSQMLLVIE